MSNSIFLQAISPDKSVFKVWLCLFICQLLPLIISTQTTAKGPEDEISVPLQSGQRPQHLFADRLVVKKEKKVVEAFGNVLLKQEPNIIEADYGLFHWDTNIVYLKGNIHAQLGPDTIEAKEARFNLDNDTGWLKDGVVFLKDSHMYFKGDRLEKTGPSTYDFKKATVTACDGSPPSWSLYTQQGKITIDGYARLRHARFQVKDIPILYSPYLILPAKRDRQSGFLMPEYISSSKEGTSINLPYYYVINEEQDLTLYTNYMSKRGIRLGTEYRFIPNLETKGLFRFDYLHDKRQSDTESEEYDEFDHDGLTRSNQDRYWLRGKMNGFLFQTDWKTKLDLDLVSDQNYLREFDSGYLGFDRSRESFLGEFGRDIDDKDDLDRENVWIVSRNWSDFGFESRMEYIQDLRYMNDNLHSHLNPTLQRLPELNLDFFKQDLLDTPFEWEARNEMTYFWRRYGTTGVRGDFHPQVSLPYQTSFLTLIPKVGWRQTVYSLDRIENPSSESVDDFDTRGIFDFETTSYTDVFRVFQLKDPQRIQLSEQTRGESFWTKIRHSLRPELKYAYIPKKDQDDLPKFDSTDRIEEDNTLTYTLTQVLTRRKDTVINSPEGNGTDYALKKDYREFLRLKLEQSYDLDEADREKNRDTYPRRPFSDIRFELDLSPVRNITYRENTWVSPYLGKITEHEHILRYSDQGFSTYFGYDYQRELDDDIHRKNQDKLEIIRAGTRIPVSPKWTLMVDYERDIAESELINGRLGVLYRHQCWSLQVNYITSEEETEVAILIGLHRLGQIGQTFSAGSGQGEE